MRAEDESDEIGIGIVIRLLIANARQSGRLIAYGAIVERRQKLSSTPPERRRALATPTSRFVDAIAALVLNAPAALNGIVLRPPGDATETILAFVMRRYARVRTRVRLHRFATGALEEIVLALCRSTAAPETLWIVGAGDFGLHRIAMRLIRFRRRSIGEVRRDSQRENVARRDAVETADDE